MKNLLKFLQRFHLFFLFLVLELIAILFAIRGNQRRYAIAVNSSNALSGFFYSRVSKYIEFFYLRTENTKLSQENSRLKNYMPEAYFIDSAQFSEQISVGKRKKYIYTSGKVIKNTTHLKNNYFTIDKGQKHGIARDMGVIASEGVAGVVVGVSNNYAVAISVLNTKIGFSSKIKKNNFYGSLVWDGKDYRKAILNEIPNHVEIQNGDTIVTSGYSTIFPENIPIGKIVDFKKNSEDNFFTIVVELFVDFKNVYNVNLIKNVDREEQLLLEETLTTQ